MKNKFLKLIACLLVAAMLATTAAFPVVGDEPADAPADAQTETTENPAEDPSAEDTSEDETPAEDSTEEDTPAEDAPAEDAPAEDASAEDAPAEDTPAEDASEEGDKASGEEEEEEVDAEFLTDEQELARCEKVCENDKFIIYLDRDYERVGIFVKETGFVHWSNPVNALLDDATSKPATKQNRLSNVGVMYGNATDLFTSSTYGYSYRESTYVKPSKKKKDDAEEEKKKSKTEFEIKDDGVVITYNFKTANAMIPVHYVLEDDYVRTYIKTSEINEKSGYKDGVNAEESETDVIILTQIALNPFMSAATSEDQGYMLIPDGSGAVINLNNGKTNYTNYSEYLYGRDITRVRELESDAVEQAYMPVMAMVRGNNGMVMIADKGDTFATVNAAVAGNKTDQCGYNYCYFSFVLRSSDEYKMAGDGSSIIVFEKGDGKIPVEEISVRYYPITSEEEIVPYTDVADVYRNYLIESEGLTKKTTANYSPLFVDYYGGTLKSKSILGIPVDIKTSYTSFDEALEITEELKALGVDDMVINYNDWTNDSMSDKIDTADSVAGCLGGKRSLNKFVDYCEENGIQFYGSVDGFTFKSAGNGFITLFDTAYRVSKSYSRQYDYNIAYGTPNSGVAAALLAPKSISKLAKKVSKNVAKLDLPGVGLGSISAYIWSDFSTKNHTSRDTTAQYVIDYYKTVKEKTEGAKIIADAPNAYLIPYVDTIKKLPLQSSQFKIADMDIPFMQMVLHGYTDYSTTAINGSADSKTLFLKAIAAGSNIQYDFIYEEATKLVNTDYVDLYYATYEGWLSQCAKEYELAKAVLAPVSDSVITGYEVDGDVITTTYSNGSVITVNIETGVINAGGQTYKYSDYVDEGGLK